MDCGTVLLMSSSVTGAPDTQTPMYSLGAITIQRLFLMDSASFEHGKRMLRNTPPDMAEVLPGIAPKAIRQLCEALDKPVIAGGLVTEPGEIALALQAGASAVSAGDQRLWNLKL